MGAMDCARFLTTYACEHGNGISNLDLQKILFLAEMAFVADYGTPMFDEEFYVWEYGVVIPGVYNVYSPAGGEPIMRQYDDTMCDVHEFEEMHPKEARAIIATYWRYANRHFDLIRDIKDNKAWRDTYDDGRGYGLTIGKTRKEMG